MVPEPGSSRPEQAQREIIKRREEIDAIELDAMSHLKRRIELAGEIQRIKRMCGMHANHPAAHP